MTVVCCESYEDIDKGDIGRVIKIDNDGLHDLNVLAHWQRKGGTYWLRFVHVELRNDLPCHGSNGMYRTCSSTCTSYLSNSSQVIV